MGTTAIGYKHHPISWRLPGKQGVHILDVETLKIKKNDDQKFFFRSSFPYSRDTLLVFSPKEDDTVTNIWDVRRGKSYRVNYDDRLFDDPVFAISPDGLKIASRHMDHPGTVDVKHLPLWDKKEQPSLKDLALLTMAKHYLSQALLNNEGISFESFKDRIGKTLLENIQIQSPKSVSYIRAMINSIR